MIRTAVLRPPVDAMLEPSGVAGCDLDDGGFDWIADETPVSLEYNGVSHAVMMATPTEIEDLAVGFTLSEGIAAHRDEILDVGVEVLPQGVRAAVTLTARRFAGLKDRRRNLAGRTGCGLCGVESLEAATRSQSPVTPVGVGVVLDPARIGKALVEMDDRQLLRTTTGATHAAAWMTPDGRLVTVREDIGRHNALDKLIGGLIGLDADLGRGAALITSRASYEMVQKAAAVGMPTLVAMSAPTALAVRTARALNVTLVGFARAGRHVVYAHPWRLDGAPATGGAS